VLARKVQKTFCLLLD
jgi:hypothetical protein